MIELTEHMVGRECRVILKDNSVIAGKCISYIPAKDNEPEIDSIWIKSENDIINEIFLPKIKQINKVDKAE